MSKINELVAKALRIRKVVFGIDKYIKQDVTIPCKTLGDPFVCWTLNLDLLSEESVVYSFGVGIDISFDLALINHMDLKINAFDPTPKSIEWIESQKLPVQFIFHKVGLANYDGKAKFHPPENPEHISATMLNRDQTKDQAYKVDVLTLKSIMQDLGHKKLDLLKMDIEGAEYDVIIDMIEKGIKPDQLLIEFHHRFKDIGIKKTVDAIKLLRTNGYKVFHTSENGEEISLIKEELVGEIEKINNSK